MRKPPEALPGFQQYQFTFTRHIRNPAQNPRPAGVEPRRMAIYNDLLYNNVESFLLRCFPVCRKILGESKWNTLARDFFANHRSTTQLFRQIPEEFVRFIESRGDDHPASPAFLPAFLPELAHYE
ncbi:MAG: putative DNA-binding domain-containing protein, partial [Burkholderiales bacterium]|nr:putative DNA-binding domain-containing protein [Burkholderiales bacterium]